MDRWGFVHQILKANVILECQNISTGLKLRIYRSKNLPSNPVVEWAINLMTGEADVSENMSHKDY